MRKALLCFVTVLCYVASLPAMAATVQDANKAVARRVFEEIFNEGKFQVADEIYAKDFVNHGIHRNANLQEDQAAARGEKTAFPDLKMTVNLMVAEDDLVTVVWTLRGTHTGSGIGLPPTGVKLELRGITVWRIADGKIREEWTSFDQLYAARQFVTQLKWPLLGILAVAVILGWLLCRVIRRPRRTRVANANP